MKILIIGAAGRLGSQVVKQLDEVGTGDTYRLADVRPIETKHEFVKCDVLDPHSLIAAMRGMDLVYSAHVGFAKPASDASADKLQALSKDFEILTRGAFNIMQGAVLLGITRMVLVTSEACRGQLRPIKFTDVCDETTPALPDYTYALAKYVQEIIAEYYSRVDGLRTVCLRNAWFSNPWQNRDLNVLGSSLLTQGSVTVEDMARASVLAILAAKKDTLPNKHEVFMLMNSTEFSKKEVQELRTNPEAVFERHYPGIIELYKKYEIDFQGPKERGQFWKIDDTSKAKRLLGWEPTFTLRTFYEDLKAGKYTKGQVLGI
jgi:nucleoside-diphosphate-sugar epimerase